MRRQTSPSLNSGISLEVEAQERVATIVAVDVGVVGSQVHVVALVRAGAKAIDDRVAVWRAGCLALAPEVAVLATIVIAGEAVVGGGGNVVVDFVIGRAWRRLVVIDQQLGRVVQVAKLAAVVDIEGDGRSGVVG